MEGEKHIPGSTTKLPTTLKRDATAAKELPGLYVQLEGARRILERLKTEKVDVHTVIMTLGPEGVQHHPANREAFNDLVRADAEQAVRDLESKIKALGFETE